MIIGIHLQGGLGNMLFQIIAGECLAKKYNIEVCYPNVRQHFDFLRLFGQWVSHCDEYLTVFKNIDWFKNEDRWGEITKVQQVPFTYTEITPKNGTKYVGYFQSEKNFFGYADFVRWILEPSKETRKKVIKHWDLLRSDNLCSIHVRRGNYLLNPAYHIVQDMSYYNRAMDVINAKYYAVFSDDRAWVRDNFIGDYYLFPYATDYVEMYLMALCGSHIIGNSSFGWLGAYIDNASPKVVAPRKWFPKTPDSRDIIPDNWIKV